VRYPEQFLMSMGMEGRYKVRTVETFGGGSRKWLRGELENF